MTDTWTIEKITALYSIIIGMKEKYKIQNIPEDFLVYEVRSMDLFPQHTDKGIVRTMQRLSNAEHNVIWPSDQPSRTEKYRKVVFGELNITDAPALNVQFNQSAAECKKSRRAIGETVTKTGNRFPNDEATYDPLTRIQRAFITSNQVFSIELEAMTPADQEAFEEFVTE